MDKKSKILLIIFILALIASIGLTYYKTVILKDFQLVGSEEELNAQ
jgi:hypothetical protein